MRPRAATTVVAVGVGGGGKGVLVGGRGVSVGPLVADGNGVEVAVAVAVVVGGRMRVAVLVGPVVGVEVDVTRAARMGVGTSPTVSEFGVGVGKCIYLPMKKNAFTNGWWKFTQPVPADVIGNKIPDQQIFIVIR